MITSASSSRGVHRWAMLAAASMLLAQAPVPRTLHAQDLPAPTGPFPIGVARLVLVDSERGEPQTADSSDQREVVVQVWYPVERTARGTAAPYVVDSVAWSDAFGAAALTRFGQVRPHAQWRASPLTTRPWPSIVMSPAAGNEPGFYSVLGEELASHGFVVLALGHPYESPLLRLADGRLAVPPAPPAESDPVRVSRDRIDWRSGDMRFVLTELTTSHGAFDRALPGLRIDPGQVVAAGHSRGGVAALEACKVDGRFRGCINLDGGVLGGPYYEDSTGMGPRAPVLWFQAYHPPPPDSQLAAWKMTRAQWDSFDIRANRLLARARGDGWRVVLPDTAHQAFSDLEWLRADDAAKDSARRTLLTVRTVLRRYAAAAIRGVTPQFDEFVQDRTLLSAEHLPEAAWAWNARAAARVDSLVDVARARDTTGGLVVGIIVGDSLVHTIVRGTADAQADRAITKDDVFRIGSITKQFTALMFLQLVESGRVALTTPVERFVPEAEVLRGFFPAAPAITLFQLATHTSGLAREPDDEILASGSSARWDTLVVRGLVQTRVLTEPGTAYRYSNFGYALLGLALSRAAGESYEGYVERRILWPLGMLHSGFRAPSSARLATGYDASSGVPDDRVPMLEHRGRGYKVPNGGLYSSVADLARFIAFETGGGPDSVLPRAVLDGNYRRLVYVNTRLTDAAGLGFVVVRDGDLTAYGHAGTVAGYDAITGFDPERRIGVIVLRNVSSGRLGLYRLFIDSMRVLRETRQRSLEEPLP
jgi:CubicO group peptidase (beta-lactamase class C family)